MDMTHLRILQSFACELSGGWWLLNPAPQQSSAQWALTDPTCCRWQLRTLSNMSDGWENPGVAKRLMCPCRKKKIANNVGKVPPVTSCNWYCSHYRLLLLLPLLLSDARIQRCPSDLKSYRSTALQLCQSPGKWGSEIILPSVGDYRNVPEPKLILPCFTGISTKKTSPSTRFMYSKIPNIQRILSRYLDLLRSPSIERFDLQPVADLKFWSLVPKCMWSSWEPRWCGIPDAMMILV